MSLFKCKMCGGSLEIAAGTTVIECEYCGTTQTLPKLDDERRVNLYDRANHFRRNNDFDKAMGIYEQILNEDNTDAEAYWSLVLCRYGIEYVEDPSSHKRLPTVNRAQFTSIFDDNNYKAALQYADSFQRRVYEEEAKAINEIQKGILAISQQEEPFDVFICYKETDNNGRRTPDSVLAQDLYYQLTQEGFKVFFSRITLEDKLGSAYEPYIFAALNSAKVMVALGTQPAYFNAVWVKNEWSRYLALIKNGAKNVLIPAYKDMDPYDLPEEFSHLQAQDMSKLGFMQDLIRGIKKLTQTNEPAPVSVVKETVVTSEPTNTAPLLKRAFMFLEDGDWSSADEYCEKVLDLNPECAEAYLGKLMAELKVRQQEQLKDYDNPFDDKNNYKKAVRFSDEALKAVLVGYIEHINTRNENARLEDIYIRTKRIIPDMATEDIEEATADDLDTAVAYLEMAAKQFASIRQYKDADALAKECHEKAAVLEKIYYEKDEIERKDDILAEGKALMTGEIISNYESAIKLFESITGWKDTDEKAILCQQKIEELKAQAEAERLEKEREAKEAERIAKRNKKIAIITTPIVCAIIAFVIVLNTVIIPNGKYNDAIALMEDGKYEEAYIILNTIGDYKDAFEKAGSIRFEKEREFLKDVQIGDVIEFGIYEQDNTSSNGKEPIEWIVLDTKDGKALILSMNALDCQSYHSSFEDITWGESRIREWLNNTFFDAAFSSHEKEKVCNTIISCEAKTTDNFVFLLSIHETDQYVKTNWRKCKPTAYAVAEGVDPSNCVLWLRSPGRNQSFAATVVIGIHYGGYGVDQSLAVRPAMWIDLNTIG